MATMEGEPKLIKTWEELAQCTSENYVLKIDVEGGNGWIEPKNPVPDKEYYNHHHYLSTHTFYGGTHQGSTELLQKCGFNIVLANWDELGW